MAIETNKKLDNVIWINKDKWYKESMRNTSHSQIESYSTCSLKWALQKVFKIKEPWSDNLAFGNVYHACVEKYFKLKEAGFSGDMAEAITEHWYSVFKEEFKDSTLAPGEFLEAQSMSKSCVAPMLEYFNNSGFEIIKIKDNDGKLIPAIELGIAVPVENPLTKKNRDDYYFLMFIDAIVRDKTGRIIILDHKTASRRYTDNKLKTSNQLPLYVYGTKELFKQNGLQYDYWVGYDVLLKQKKIVVEYCEKQITGKDINRMLLNVNMALDGMCKGCYCPSTNEMVHSYCNYFDICFGDSEEINLEKIYGEMRKKDVLLDNNMEAENVTRPISGANNIQKETTIGGINESPLIF